MALNRYGNKRDANEPEIFDILRGYGVSVHPLDTPCDAIVGAKGVTYLVEVKNGPKAKLTKAQKEFIATWKGCYEVLTTLDEAESFARHITGRL